MLLVHGQSVGFDFTNYDDPEYVTENPNVAHGLSLASLRWAFSTFHQANWHPLTWISLMLDAQIAGVDPRMFHLTNVLLHLANTLLLFHVLVRLTGRPGRSAFVAALFGVHPLHVESVAWIAERKDVLSTMFWFLTLLAWKRHLERPGAGRYALAVLAFGAGLLSKPMLVTLPVTLLLFDFWPLDRLGARGEGAWPRIREKLPLFAMSAASCVVTLVAQQRGGALATFERYPLAARAGNAVVAGATYLRKMLWPADLAVFYPHPGTVPPVATLLAGGLVLLLVTGLALALFRARPYLAVGWLWFLVTVSPVIGLVQVGLQSMADRYTYIPLIGPFIMVAWGVPDLLRRWGGSRELSRRGLAAAAVAVVAALAAAAFVQVRHWRNSRTLFERALLVTENNPLARNNLGSALFHAGRIEEAIVHYREAVRLHPRHAVALNNLAGALMKVDEAEEAVLRWTEAVRAKPDFVDARTNLAGALFLLGRVDEAIRESREALRRDPDNGAAHYNLALALLRSGEVEQAGIHLEATLRASPEDVDARVNLGVVRAKQGRLEEALRHFEEALRLDPTSESARRNRDLARQRYAAEPQR